MAGDYRQDSVDVRREIREHFGDALADCDRLREHAVGMFEAWTGRGIESTADGLVVAILARSVDTFTCAVRNARVGYGQQASMLNRSLFEDMADAHWIVTDPDTAASRYVDHHEHGRMVLADAVAAFPTMYADVDAPEFDAEERKRLDKLFGQYGHKPWSTISLHERVGLIEDQWTDPGGREVLRFMHAIAHRENNQTLHVSAQSLGAVVTVDETGRPAFSVGPRPDMVHRALYGAFWTFAQTVTLAVDQFGFPLTVEEREALCSVENFHRPEGAGEFAF